MPIIDPPSYSGYRFPDAIISHCTSLYCRFALSYRDVEEMMSERRVNISYEGTVKLPGILMQWRDGYYWIGLPRISFSTRNH